METMKLQKKVTASTMLDPKIIVPAISPAFAKLIKNPVMFVVEIVAALTTVIFLRNLVTGGGESLGFTFQIILWLWFTVLFANFAEPKPSPKAAARRRPSR
jgi:K+-transporting ATPase ATPase B chain